LSQDNRTIIQNFTQQIINEGQMDLAANYVWDDVIEQVPLPG